LLGLVGSSAVSIFVLNTYIVTCGAVVPAGNLHSIIIPNTNTNSQIPASPSKLIGSTTIYLSPRFAE
jgi:hypothetical protein